jgi:hypothetical protein
MGALLVRPSLQSTGGLRNIEKGSHLNRGRGDLVPERRKPKPGSGVLSGCQRVHSSAEAMNEEFATVLEAIRRAQAELAAYLSSRDHNAELTIAKLVGILDRREVVGATRLLYAVHNSSPAPKIG